MEATVAGNVGTPLASLPGEIDPSATIVCECSSFQLEDSLAFAPEVAVLLNVTPDHLDRHGTLAAYAEAKLRIFSNQTPEDTAIVDADDPVVGEVELPGEAIREPFGIDACADEQRCAVSFADGEIRDSGGVLVRADELPLAGEHNLRNAMAVAAAALASGADREGVARGLRSFAGVPHRLERVRELDGVVYVHDSKATNVAAAAAALAAFGSGVHAISAAASAATSRTHSGGASPLHRLLPGRGGRSAPASGSRRRRRLHDSGDLAALADAGGGRSPRGRRSCSPPRAPASTPSATTRSAASASVSSSPHWRAGHEQRRRIAARAGFRRHKNKPKPKSKSKAKSARRRPRAPSSTRCC